MKPKRFAFALSLAAAALASGIGPSSAGDRISVGISVDVHDDYHRGHLRPWHHHYVRPLTGPEIYYSYHYDHIPGYPVPIFPSLRPPVVVQPVVRYVSSPHVAWCQARYRSYRAYDNSFQPYHGARRQCWSPFS